MNRNGQLQPGATGPPIKHWIPSKKQLSPFYFAAWKRRAWKWLPVWISSKESSSRGWINRENIMNRLFTQRWNKGCVLKQMHFINYEMREKLKAIFLRQGIEKILEHQGTICHIQALWLVQIYISVMTISLLQLPYSIFFSFMIHKRQTSWLLAA